MLSSMIFFPSKRQTSETFNQLLKYSKVPLIRRPMTLVQSGLVSKQVS